MKLIHLGSLPIILILVLSCTPKNDLPSQVLGKWKMYKVYEAREDVTNQHNPENDRWIKFNKDGSFESGGSMGYNTGQWSIDESSKVLYIKSNMENDDSMWHIQINDDETIWTGIGDPRKETFKLIHKRL